MTDAEWLACTDPQPMLEFVRGKASDRKLRLFACACCRRIWRQLTDERSRSAVEVAERYADGAAGAAELQAASLAAVAAGVGFGVQYSASNAAHFAVLPGPVRADSCAESAARGNALEPAAQARLLGCIFGAPFHPRLAASWRSTTVNDLAQAIYADRAFDRLQILADALEDAGCTDRAILDHCRQPGEHARGCWVVDLVLGKS